MHRQPLLLTIIRRLGFHVSFGKVASPQTTATFLGINIDTVALEVSLPQDKLAQLITILGETRGRKKITRKDLERLGGLLAHYSKVVRGGRTFCHRLYDSINSVDHPHHLTQLSRGFRDDIDWWYAFIERFNRPALSPPLDLQ